ncbi:hypothetical protein AB0M02_43215 [Actinoplanes sp. NPDC051861]|uniref:WXG100 family type VII secretion target n=1 Tax=Actinoplanes sp. NPDC051861 TaxID=3155170 RepID=UPI0034294200
MVSVGLRVDPDALTAVSSELAGIAKRMADDVAALEATVAAPGAPWGADEGGSAFGVAYQGVLGHALTALGSYVQQVGQAAVGLAVQARSVAMTDASSAASLGDPP